MFVHSDICMRLLAVILLTHSLSGCATLLTTGWPQQAEKVEFSSSKRPIGQIVCLWNPAEGRDPEGKPCRGFAGQVMFMEARSAVPLAVRGEIRVYVFDNIGTTEEQMKPVHQFDFDADVWNMHRQSNTLGPAYNVFIPYMRKGNHAAVCSVRLRYIPEGGNAPLFSDMISVRMEGSQPAMASAAMNVERFVGPAGVANDKSRQMLTQGSMVAQDNASGPASESGKGAMRATTIPIETLQQQASRESMTRQLAAQQSVATSTAHLAPSTTTERPVPQQTSTNAVTTASSRRIRPAAANAAQSANTSDSGIAHVSYEESTVEPTGVNHAVYHETIHPLADAPAGERPHPLAD